MRNQSIVISPSGAYYGSEQMLHEHLIYSKNIYRVFVQMPGTYFKILSGSKLNHKLSPYKSITLLYVKVFFLLLLGGTKSVYVNEGGHIKYIKLLAKLFKNKKFVVHIRLVEDTKAERLGNELSTNIQLICVSDFIRKEILGNNPKINTNQVITVHDYYIPGVIEPPKEEPIDVIKVGIIGRVSAAKGISKANNLLQYWDKTVQKPIEFYFYGDVIDDKDVLIFKSTIKSLSNVKVFFKGFVSDKESFFKSFDMVIHFNAFEPFPRIYFDSMARLKPVLGFDSGGIGEQARIFGFETILVNLDADWAKNMSNEILEVANNLFNYKQSIYLKRNLFESKLRVEKYIDKIESYL